MGGYNPSHKYLLGLNACPVFRALAGRWLKGTRWIGLPNDDSRSTCINIMILPVNYSKQHHNILTIFYGNCNQL
jgi:hypothetical protein